MRPGLKPNHEAKVKVPHTCPAGNQNDASTRCICEERVFVDVATEPDAHVDFAARTAAFRELVRRQR